MIVVEWLIVVFVTARIGRFGAEDILPEPVREKLVNWLPYQSLWARGLLCRWCWHVWAATGTVLVWWLISPTPHVWDRWYADLPGVILAVAYAASLAQRWEPED